MTEYDTMDKARRVRKVVSDTGGDERERTT